MKNWRIYILLGIIFIFGSALIGRLFYIQVLNRKFYQAQALGQQAGFQEITGSRGQIFFTNSKESKGASRGAETKSLAINRDVMAVSAIPREIEDKNIFAETLSKYLGESKEFIFSKIENQDSYVVIKKGITGEKTIEDIKGLKLKGLYWELVPERYYPQEGLAAPVSGFVGGDETGQYGLEGYYDEELKGKSGIKEAKRGLDAVFSESRDLLNGTDLYLTIDYNIQFEAESLLREAKENLDIDSGQIIVLKPDSGRVLALANFPSFDLNEYSKVEEFGIFQNSATQKLFEPGSVLKPFTMAIGINENKITPDAKFFDKGYVEIGEKTIYNFAREKYGEQTMTQVLEKSINTGAVFVEEKISHDAFFDYMAKFGFTEKTGVDLQGEVFSKNEILKNGPDVQYATAAYGQGIEITPIQLAKGFCIFANSGKLIKPYVNEKAGPHMQDQVISENTALEVTKMMVSVLENGLAKSARVPGYYLAGKTGTAQVPLENGKGYDEEKTIQSFIGFGPAFNPKFLILVKLDNPKVSLSSLSSTPVFRKLAQYIINYWQIPPDYEATK